MTEEYNPYLRSDDRHEKHCKRTSGTSQCICSVTYWNQ